MRYRAWLWASFALLALGIGGVAYGFPLSPSSDPPLTDVRFAPSSPPSGAVLVDGPGPHTVWQAGGTRDDQTRCRISTPDGAAVTLDEPRVMVRWEPTWSDTVDVYAEVGTFEAPVPGIYGIQCAVDPDASGTSFVVTEKPDLTRATVSAVAGAVLLIAAVTIAVTVLVRRRRRAEV
jgi:hypothetical protein